MKQETRDPEAHMGVPLTVGEQLRLGPEGNLPVYRVARVSPCAAYITRKLTPRTVTVMGTGKDDAGFKVPVARTFQAVGEETLAISPRSRVWRVEGGGEL